jgi:hypothetical protein
VAKVVRRQGENLISLGLRARLELAALGSHNRLVVLTSSQAAHKSKQLSLPATERAPCVDVEDAHWAVTRRSGLGIRAHAFCEV